MKWIVAALALFCLALAFNLGLLVYAIYALIVVVIVARVVTSSWSANVRGKKSISKTRASIGEFVDVVIDVENTGGWPVTWMLVEDLVPPSATFRTMPALAFSGERVSVTKFSAGETKRMSYRMKCNRRGYFQIGPTIAETGDMFGFNRRYRVLSEPKYLLVYPKIIPLAGYDIASKRPIGEVVMTNRLFEDPTRIAGVRDYQLGDPLNRIHWKKSASTGKLQSKIYEPSSLAGATLVLDFHADSFDPKHEPMRSELAITAAASIAYSLVQMGQQVGFVSNGRDAVDRIREEGWRGDERTRDEARASVTMKKTSDRLRPVVVPTRKSPEQALNIFHALARLELTGGMKLPTLLIESASQLPRDATVIAIVSEMNMERAVALGGLKKQGYSVVAIVNTFNEEKFVQTTAPLLAEGIGAMHLKDEDSIRTICEKQALMT